MNIPLCPKCGFELRDQWSSRVKIVKAFRIMREHGMPVEKIASALGLGVGQLIDVQREENARAIEQDRLTP